MEQKLNLRVQTIDYHEDDVDNAHLNCCEKQITHSEEKSFDDDLDMMEDCLLLTRSLSMKDGREKFLYFPSLNKLGTPTNRQQQHVQQQQQLPRAPRAVGGRSASPTDELCPYLMSPSHLIRQRMKTESPMLYQE